MNLADKPQNHLPRAFLRWAGSKKQILPLIKFYWGGGFKQYIEPFCGSASLFFDLNPQSAQLSDINEELINTLKCVRDECVAVTTILNTYPTDKDSYYLIRAMRPADLSSTSRAARFIYLNALCFNGLYRVNRAGHFNVPYGSKHRKIPFDLERLETTSKALKSAKIIHCDFESAIDRSEQGDFLYADPPYSTVSARVFNEYTAGGFDASDIKRLKLALERADARGVNFVLSYADVPEAQEMARHWGLRQVQTRRNIAGFSGSRKIVSEVLISNIGLK